MLKRFTVEGIVLSLSHLETDILLTLYSREKGKIQATAKGASRLSSRRLSSLQPGFEISAVLSQKNSYLYLQESQTIKSFIPKNSFGQLSFLFLFLELLKKLSPWEEPSPPFYQIAQRGIRELQKGNYPRFLREQIKLSQILGFGLSNDIIKKYQKGDWRSCQLLLKKHFEEIIESPLESFKLLKRK